MSTWQAYQDQHKDRFLAELLDLLRIPSVSARSEHRADMQTCAAAVRQHLLRAGVDKAEVYPTAGHPVVYGEKIIDPKKPTVLVYGHYDVQPPDPLELWHSGPFDPVIKDGKIYARGSADDKGQFFMHVKASSKAKKRSAVQASRPLSRPTKTSSKPTSSSSVTRRC
jgi:acetylornithine deacetylase/succinyl-diaminopimelate desuccinylase-like protein